MNRSVLRFPLAPIAALLAGCVAEMSGVGPAGTGGAVGSGGASIAGATGGAPSGSGGSGSGGSGIVSDPLSGSGGAVGSGGRAGTGGASTTTGSGGATGACTTDALPATVQIMLNSKCISCHGAVPLAGAPSLVTFSDLTAPARTDPTKTNAAMMLTRIQSAAAPMPPVGGTPATPTEIAALQAWVNANYPKATCTSGAGGAGGSVLPPPTGPDPFSVAPVCTSNATSNGGESATMDPGQACVTCHRSSGEAPIFSIAGTLYPTGHEPNNCNGTNGTTGARIVITGADGAVVTLTPGSTGNFSTQAAVKTPYHAKVTYMGRERLMVAAQTNGDCNACHTQTGSMLAPGRIVLP